jgi:hypothetical protein
MSIVCDLLHVYLFGEYSKPGTPTIFESFFLYFIFIYIFAAAVTLIIQQVLFFI